MARSPTFALAVSAFAVAVLLSVAAGDCGAGAPGLEGVRRALAAEKGLLVARGDAIWEETPGALGAALSGRRALVLASAAPGAPRDLYRAEVRGTPDSAVLHVDRVVNLTDTPHADEGGLVASGHWAAYASRAFGRVSAVVVLDLAGEASGSTGLVDRTMATITNLLETHDSNGIGRTRLRFVRPADDVELTWRGTRLEIRWPSGEASYQAGRGLDGPAREALEARSLVHLPKRPILWAVDTARWLVGSEPIAWLENRVFALTDVVRRTVYSLESDGGAAARPARLGPYVAVETGGWPPPRARSAFENALPGEGVWVPAGPEWLPRIPGAPAAFYETFVRPDPVRPYSKVRVLAMDGRQLLLGMEAGTEDPRSTTGAVGSGKIPRRPEVLDRVVGAFNGAFKTEHGEYGMMVEGTVLLPPVPGGATVATFEDGRIGFGDWDEDPAVPRQMVSFRQNLTALVDGGVVNPAGRRRWGWPRAGSDLEAMQTHRSGICQLVGGHFAYVWGDDANGPALGEAMRRAGCVYGIHLDMNTHHTGFHFLRVRTTDDYDMEPWHELMVLGYHRFVKASLKDFFYVTLRSSTPIPLGGVAWRSDGLPQPDPAFLPALHSAEVEGVRVVSIRSDRTDLVLRAGASEPPTGTGEAPPSALDEALARDALLAFGAGPAGGNAPGLVVDGHVYFPIPDGQPALVRTASRGLAIGPWPVPGAVDAVQGSLLPAPGSVDAGAAESGESGGNAAAVGLTADGRLLYVDGAPAHRLAEVLRRAAASSAMLLGRGAAPEPFLELAGAGLRRGYDQATVFVRARASFPLVFRMDHDGSVLASAR